MPRGNKTGPAGDGAMTGRAQGYCTGNNQPGFISNQSNQNMGYGRGMRGRGFFDVGRGMGRNMGGRFGRGFGQGFGFRNDYQNTFPENNPAVTDKTLIETIKALNDKLKPYLEKQPFRYNQN